MGCIRPCISCTSISYCQITTTFIQSHTHIYTQSTNTLIGVHEMHGRMHPNQRLATNLLVNDLLSSLGYPMITHVPLVACNLPIKTLVARQLPTNTHTQTQAHTYMYTYIQRHACAYTHTHTTSKNTYVYTQAHAHVQIYTHAHIHKHK